MQLLIIFTVISISCGSLTVMTKGIYCPEARWTSTHPNCANNVCEYTLSSNITFTPYTDLFACYWRDWEKDTVYHVDVLHYTPEKSTCLSVTCFTSTGNELETLYIRLQLLTIVTTSKSGYVTLPPSSIFNSQECNLKLTNDGVSCSRLKCHVNTHSKVVLSLQIDYNYWEDYYFSDFDGNKFYDLMEGVIDVNKYHGTFSFRCCRQQRYYCEGSEFTITIIEGGTNNSTTSLPTLGDYPSGSDFVLIISVAISAGTCLIFTVTCGIILCIRRIQIRRHRKSAIKIMTDNIRINQLTTIEVTPISTPERDVKEMLAGVSPDVTPDRELPPDVKPVNDRCRCRDMPQVI